MNGGPSQMRKSCRLALLVLLLLGLTNIAVGQEQSIAGVPGKSAFSLDCPSTPAEAHECGVLEQAIAPRLKQLGEPPLASVLDSSSISVYRLTLTALTGPIPIRMARITVKNNSNVEIIAKRKDFDNQVRTTLRILLPPEDAKRLVSMLQWEDFDSMDPSVQSSNDPSIRNTRGVTVESRDGGTMYLEGARGNDLHVIHRRAPNVMPSVDPGYRLMRDLFDYLNRMRAWNVVGAVR